MTWIDMRRVIAEVEHVPAASIHLVGYDKNKYDFDIDESYYETDEFKNMKLED